MGGRTLAADHPKRNLSHEVHCGVSLERQEMRGASLKAATNAVAVKARKYPIVRGASRVAETLEIFQPDGPHASSLVPAKATYKTAWGAMYEGDAATLLATLPNESLDLVITSPPYALHFKKEYGNVHKDA